MSQLFHFSLARSMRMFANSCTQDLFEVQVYMCYVL